MNEHLRTESRIEDPDDFYARLIALHAGLSTKESQMLNSKLVLMLANHIGDHQVLGEVLEIARGHIPTK